MRAKPNRRFFGMMHALIAGSDAGLGE